MKGFCLLVLFSFTAWSAEMRPFGFITPKAYELADGLPPKIKLTYERPCNARFVKVIRHESEDPDTKEMTIALGVMVKSDRFSSCGGVSDETVDAGTAFSGRAHTIEFIQTAKPHHFQKRGYEEIPQARASIHGSKKGVACPVIIQPGKSLGVMELGRRLEEFDGMGMTIKKVMHVDRVYLIGPYVAAFDESGKLIGAEAELGDLPECVHFKGKVVNPASAIKSLRTTFKGCGVLEKRYGGNVVKCQGLNLTEGGWGGSQKTVGISIHQ